MPVFSKFSAFFGPKAPPPPLPLITAQTDLFFGTPPYTLLCQEEIVAMVPRAPNRCPSTTLKRKNIPNVTAGNEEYASDFTDEADQEDEIELEEDLIPKPPGEPGRPNCGGYNLQEAINLDPVTYKKLKSHVDTLIDKYLDPSSTISRQNTENLTRVQAEALARFPVLRDYFNIWPVTNLIKMRLKYTSLHVCRSARVTAVKQAQKALKEVGTDL